MFSNSKIILLSKKPLRKSVIKYFEEKNITKKRCLIKCINFVHGLALVEKDKEITKQKQVVGEKVRNNYFNFDKNVHLSKYC